MLTSKLAAPSPMPASVRVPAVPRVRAPGQQSSSQLPGMFDDEYETLAADPPPRAPAPAPAAQTVTPRAWMDVPIAEALARAASLASDRATGLVASARGALAGWKAPATGGAGGALGTLALLAAAAWAAWSLVTTALQLAALAVLAGVAMAYFRRGSPP